MIFDKLENYKTYESLSENLRKGFKYLRNDFTLETADGRYDIDGDKVFALVSSYKTKAYSEGAFESHKKYLDIQYVASGEELMGVTGLENLSPKTEFNYENDIVFYNGDGQMIKLPAGYFMVLFPQDGHKPGIMAGDERLDVKKVVVKVLI
jgi:YhcH/YjgK/YiaL family protein